MAYDPRMLNQHDPYSLKASSASIELRVRTALRMDVLTVSSGYAIAVNGEVYVGSTVEDCVKHIVTALVTKGLE